ncbi:MAG: hypothetical protein HZB26_09835 [Candidatus Hydrogenedentes bacterium]|nr:hypothetical protein [Candidatus Hydrogenedentota bacterium]
MSAISFLLAVMTVTGAAPADALRTCEVRDVVPQVTDETVYCWLNGWVGDIGEMRAPASPQWVAVHTGQYGFVLDPQSITTPHAGRLDPNSPGDIGNSLKALPSAAFSLEITIGGVSYRCVRGAEAQKDYLNFPVRLIEGGRFLQRFDVLNLVFESADGQRAPVDARLEVIAWPDRLGFVLEATPRGDLPAAELRIAFGPNGKDLEARAKAADAWKAGASARVALSWMPTPVSDAEAGSVAARNIRGDKAALDATTDADRGWQRIALPKESWSVASDPDHLDRIQVDLTNPSDAERVFRLMFALDEGFEGVTGMCPMIRDESGQPAGIPVQISKNWHQQKDRRLLYEGPWFHGVTVLRLPAKSKFAFEFTMAYARWGGVPAASHAQLCLIGWGHNQVWEQAAIGSWGESICYEPDAIQKRCRITDVRPLMVRSMSENQPQWTWTNNVGGGDFLVYYDAENRYQPLKEVESRYVSQGPCLTRAVYRGVTTDERIRTTVEASLPRSDDYVRVFHKVRYDVLKPTPFKRLAFYQLGADDYNWHRDGRIARGDAAGVKEEWKPNYGGRVYDRTGIRCDGAAPWFAMLESDGGNDKNSGAWANRGIMLRAWNARLGGKDAAPSASVYRSTSGKFDSALIELAPPADLKQLEPGDFVEAEVEMVIMPLAAGDYYGPNEALRKALVADANTWKMFHREAAGNNLDVRCSRGELLHTYPLAIQVAPDQSAVFEVTGGVGYVPITFSGLRRHNGHQVVIRDDGKDTVLNQSVHGADFWQTTYDPAARTWSQTYNISFDTDQPRRTRVIRFERKAS